MKDIEFNLLDEPWVRVMDGDCNVVELSLKDTIINAHKYGEGCRVIEAAGNPERIFFIAVFFRYFNCIAHFVIVQFHERF